MLTGSYRFRKGLWGKTVLQVEEEVTPFWSTSGEVKRRWRDAGATDLIDPAILYLFDLGRKPLISLLWARRSLGRLERRQDRGDTLDGKAPLAASKASISPASTSIP